MSAAQHDFEHIVREVLRRLREPEPTQENHDPSAVLRISHKLITLATLEGKLAGVGRVIARPGTIVTPAVRDELGKRNIELTFAEQVRNETPTPSRLLLATALATYNPAALFGRLANTGIQIEQLAFTDWKQAVQKMTNQLTDTNLAGVLLTDRPAAAACLANRNSAIRAAVASDAASAISAVETLGANLLTVDPAAHSLQTLEKLLREYARQGRVVCPSEFQGA